MNVLIIDNYDSFTYNLYQYAGEILEATGEPFNLEVRRNDAITLEEIRKHRCDRIILSPGPGDPSDSAYFGICADILLEIGKTVPVLGVCLGMQGIGHYYGGEIVRAAVPMHGKTSTIRHNQQGIFQGLPQEVEIMRYHSLVVRPESLPAELIITATTNDTDEIMGLHHAKYPIEGIQFHPESFATEGGKQMVRNFLISPYEPHR